MTDPSHTDKAPETLNKGRVGKPSGLGPSGFDPSRGPVIRQARAIAARHVTCADFVLEGKGDAWPEVKSAKDGLLACREITDRIRDIDYWEGCGSDLLDWVALGYVERADGSRDHNLGWRPLRDSDGSPKVGDACGSVHDSAGPKDIAKKQP
jgi:hypothetical protein